MVFALAHGSLTDGQAVHMLISRSEASSKLNAWKPNAGNLMLILLSLGIVMKVNCLFSQHLTCINQEHSFFLTTRMCIFSCNSYAMQGMKMQTWIILSHASKCKNMNNFHSVKPYATSQDLYSSSTEDIIFTPQPLTHIQAVFQNTWSLYHTCAWRPGYQVHTCACVCVWERIRIIFHMDLMSAT